jgi:cyanate permease
LGTALTLAMMPGVLAAVGTWQRAVAVSSIPGWITIVLSILVVRRPPPAETLKALTEAAIQSAASGVSYARILGWPVTWLGMFIFFCNAWGFYTLYNVVPPYLSIPSPMGLGLSPDTAGLLSLLLVIIGIPSFILGGVFFDRVAKSNPRPAIFIAFILAGASACLLIQPFITNSLILLSIVLMIAGFGPNFLGASLTGFIAMNYPSHLVGSMIGFWFGIGTLGGACGIYLAGVTSAVTGSFDWGFRFIALATVVGFFFTFALSPRSEKAE